MADVAFISQLQLRLTYDISVLYRVPINVHDPEDLWKLIRVAFTIKSGEAANKTVTKAIPVMVRPLVKRFYSGSVLTAGRALPVVGKHLLQRNVIKIGIPLVGVPLPSCSTATPRSWPAGTHGPCSGTRRGSSNWPRG